MQVTIDDKTAFAPSNLECSKVDAFPFSALILASFLTIEIIRNAFVFWSVVKLQNSRIILTEDEWNTEIIEIIIL
jgi:hypothetical protein